MKSLRAFGIGIFLAGAAFTIYQQVDNRSAVQQDEKAKTTYETTIHKLEKSNAALTDEVARLEKQLSTQKEKAASSKKETADTASHEKNQPGNIAAKDYDLNITSAMGSTEITTQLQQAGIIANARDFEKHIIAKHKATNLQNGTFHIKKGMSYDDILNVIAK